MYFFLGIEVIPTASGLFLTQQHYVCDLLKQTRMDEAKIVATPLSTNVKLKLEDGYPLVDAIEFRHVISILQYLSFTRPDISFTVNKLAQFMHSSSSTHWQATKRLMHSL